MMIKPPSIDRLYRDAVKTHKAGDLNSAARGYRAALSLDPTRLPALNDLAATRAAQGHSDDDARIYQTAIAHHPGAVETQAQTKSCPNHRCADAYSSVAR